MTLDDQGRARVMLVDDDPGVRRLFELALEEMPIQLLCCASVAEAREELQRLPVDLLITDLMMPGETGFDLLAELLQKPQLRGEALCVVFSAGLNAATRAKLVDLGVWREMFKPVSLTTLEECVRDALALRSERRHARVAAAYARRASPPRVAALREDLARPPVAAGGRAASQRLPAGAMTALNTLFGGDVALYMDFRRQALEQFGLDLRTGDSAHVDRDWSTMQRLAHSLRSVWRLLGNPDAERLAEQLEAGAAARDPVACAERWPPLRAALAQAISGA